MKKIKKQTLKPIPKFKTEDDEQDFWATHDTTEYFDLTRAAMLDFSRLKFSTKPVTVRLANKRDVPGGAGGGGFMDL